MTEREQYILDQTTGTRKLCLNINEDILNQVKALAEKDGLTLEQALQIELVELMMAKAKESIENVPEGFEVIDMFEMYRIEELMDENRPLIVATHSKPVMLLPIKQYEEMKSICSPQQK